MPSFDHRMFSYSRFEDLFGIPYRDPRVQDVFRRAGLLPNKLVSELRTGIYAMAPHDKAPCPVTEIDLSPSYRIRVRFKEARLVLRPPHLAPVTSVTPVLSGVIFLLGADDDVEPFSGQLPFGIQSGDDLKAVARRVGVPPSKEVFSPDDDSGYATWEGRLPILHVLFAASEPQVPLQVSTFLPPAGRGV